MALYKCCIIIIIIIIRRASNKQRLIYSNFQTANIEQWEEDMDVASYEDAMNCK